MKPFTLQENATMLNIPPSLRTQFETCLQKKGVPKNQQRYYYKWLRYYLDFCHKYHFPHDHKESLPHFLKKLQEKRQTQTQQEQAAHAIGLYYDLLASVPTPDPSQEGSELSIENCQLSIVNSEDRSQEGSELSIENCQLSIVNSSSGCGHLNAELTLTDRTYVCTTCGMVKNRNLNAAINLEKEAKAEMNDHVCLCFAEQVDSYDLQP